ncbi:hypothetical protein AgCh_030336 [Apium graveolens]
MLKAVLTSVASKPMLKSAARVLVPAKFGDHGIKGMILAANYVPYLGIFLGMQISVIDFARSVLDGSDDMLVRHLIREEVLKWQRKGNQPDRPVHLGVLQEWFGIHWGNTRAFALLFTLIFISLPLVLFRRVGMAISALLEGKTNTPKLIPQLDNRASLFNLFAASPVTVTAFTFHFNGLPEVKATLVICPLVVVIQWVNEIDRFNLRGSNKVLVCHGGNRGKTLHEFSDYDFVITTYSIVEAEYRKNVMPAKYKCIWCGKLLFYEHKISIHLKYFGGPNAIRTNKQSKQKKGKNPELNRSEKGKGVESVDEGKEESSKKGKHYNKDKTFGAGSSTNKSEGVEYGSCNGKSTLHSVKWDRIILEEVSREHKGKIYEVIDETRAFVEVLCDATNFASADTIYGFAAYPSGENCLGNAALVS